MTLFALGMIGGHISAALLAWLGWTMLIHYGEYRYGANVASIQHDFYTLGRLPVRLVNYLNDHSVDNTRLEFFAIAFMCGMIMQTAILIWTFG